MTLTRMPLRDPDAANGRGTEGRRTTGFVVNNTLYTANGPTAIYAAVNSALHLNMNAALDPGLDAPAADRCPICRHARRYTPCEMASTLTPEQIEVYAATLRARSAETARRRRERREQAWTVARQAAQVLRSQFGVTSVWVFGSLAEGDHFTERSDIDMAATGFTPAVHVEALGRLLRLSADFEFDLVDLDHCPHGLRRAVEQSGVDL